MNDALKKLDAHLNAAAAAADAADAPASAPDSMQELLGAIGKKEKRSAVVAVRLEQDLKNLLHQISEKLGKSESEVVHDVLKIAWAKYL